MDIVCLKNDKQTFFSIFQFLSMSDDEREEYKGNIICIECEKNAYFTRPAKDGKKASFGARHIPGCKKSSSHKSNYSEGKIEQNKVNTNTSFYEVSWNYYSKSKNKFETENDDDSNDYKGENIRKYNKKPTIQKNGSISLNQILEIAEYNLINKQDILINLIDQFKSLEDVVVHMKDINDTYLKKYNFYWGEIHNFNENWLNTNYKNKISILIDDLISDRFWDLYKKRLYRVIINNSIIVFGKVRKSKNNNYYIIVRDIKKIYFRKSKCP